VTLAQCWPRAATLSGRPGSGGGGSGWQQGGDKAWLPSLMMLGGAAQNASVLSLCALERN
jgi:hypothetical protein